MSLIGCSITRRECAKCGAAVGEIHADECPVDRHAPIVEVEYVPAEQLRGAVNLDDEAVIERATRALCDEEWWEDDWMTAMDVVGIVFQAAKGGQ
jgi:hypothetical protein